MWAVFLVLGASLANALSPCNSLRTVAVASRATHANQTVGGSNATEVLVLNGGDTLVGDVYVMASATLLLQPGTTSPSAPIIIQGNIYLFDNATLYVAAGTQVSLAQTSPSQYNLYAFDASVVGYEQAVVEHGDLLDLLQTWFICHNSKATVSKTDYGQRKRGSVAAFVYDSASLTVSEAKGNLIEATLAQSASLTVANNNASFGCNIYLVANEPLTPFVGWKLGTMLPSLSQIITSPSGELNVSIAVTNSVTSLGLWLQPGAQVVLNTSQVLLFPSWGATSTFYSPPSDLQPCNTIKGSNPCQSYEDTTFKLGNGISALSVRFLKSEVYLWNVYFEGGGFPTLHALSQSTVGETNCRDQANCTYTGVAVDGSGGYCIVEKNAFATFTQSAVVTYTFIRDHSSAIFDSSTFSFNGRIPGIRVQVEGNSSMKAINTVLPTVSSTNNTTVVVLGLVVAEDSHFLRASILPLPTAPLQLLNCTEITAPEVEMEVLPLSAPRSYLLEVFDDTQNMLATRSIAAAAAPAFFRGGAEWGGANPLAIPTTSGMHFIQITTTSGAMTAVARQYVNVTGCKDKGCPYDLIGFVFENCYLENFLPGSPTCFTPCKQAAVNLGRGWFNMNSANRSACVMNYPNTVAAKPLPVGLNMTLAASRLAGRDLCTEVSGALQQGSSVLCVLACLLFGVLFF